MLAKMKIIALGSGNSGLPGSILLNIVGEVITQNQRVNRCISDIFGYEQVRQHCSIPKQAWR